MVDAADDGRRLDQVAARCFAAYSRERLKQWISEGALTVNGRPARRPRDPVTAGDRLCIDALAPARAEVRAEAIALNVCHEDEAVLVIDKPAGLTVHPGAGQSHGTLQNALLHRCPELAAVPRAGIVHRLDKLTSGLMVVARTLQAHTAMVRAMQAREVQREYDAVVHGVPTGGGVVDAPIGRHPTHRTRMAVTADGKPARTHYRVVERYAHQCLLRCRLETGRTHQIRVHMQHIRYPLVGDPLYGARGVRGSGMDEGLRQRLMRFPRQALHARRLAFAHPLDGAVLEFESAWPEDFAALVEALRSGGA